MRDWLERDEGEAALGVVFLPMLGSDDRAGAAGEAGRFDDPRVTCFWDAGRATGTAWTLGYQRPLLAKLRAGLADDDPLVSYVQQWMESGRPVWDVAYFFDGSARWPDEGLPSPAAWAKQLQYGLDENGHTVGNFWRSRSVRGLEWSSWSEEFAAGMGAIRVDDR